MESSYNILADMTLEDLLNELKNDNSVMIKKIILLMLHKNYELSHKDLEEQYPEYLVWFYYEFIWIIITNSKKG